MLKDFMLGVGVGVGVSVGGPILIKFIITAIKNYIAQKDSEKVDSVYVDELNIGEIKKWFSDKITKNTLKGIILYPTPDNIAKWKLNIDASEQGNILIQAVYDEEHDKIVDYREVIFGILNSKLKELLDTNGGVLVIEN